MIERMTRNPIILTAAFACLATGAWADAILTYAPATLQPGVPTVVTVSVSDSTGVGFGVGQVNLNFAPPAGVSLTGFGWQSGLDTGGQYFANSTLNAPWTLLYDTPAVNVPGAPGSTAAFSLTVTLDAGASPGQQFMLPVNATITNQTLANVPVSIRDASGNEQPDIALTTVPEPATLALLLVGGLAALRRRIARG